MTSQRTHLYPGFVEFRDSGQFFSDVDVWVVTLGEGRLKLLQLFLGEGRAVATSGGGGAHCGVV